MWAVPNGRVAMRVLGLALLMLVITGLFQLTGKWEWVRQALAALHVGKDAGGWVGRVFMTRGLERCVAAFGATLLSLGAPWRAPPVPVTHARVNRALSVWAGAGRRLGTASLTVA